MQYRLSGDHHCRQATGPGTDCRDAVFLENHLIKGMAVRGVFIGIVTGIGIMIVRMGVAVFEWTIAGNGIVKNLGMMMMRHQVMAQ